MSSRSWQSFDGKIRMLKQHLQLSDLALTLANKKAISLAGNGEKIVEALGASIKVYRQLNIPNEKIDISRIFITSIRNHGVGTSDQLAQKKDSHKQ